MSAVQFIPMGRPKATKTLDVNLNLRVDAEVKSALKKITEVWDERARENGARATEAGVVRELILREARDLGLDKPAKRLAKK